MHRKWEHWPLATTKGLHAFNNSIEPDKMPSIRFVFNNETPALFSMHFIPRT